MSPLTQRPTEKKAVFKANNVIDGPQKGEGFDFDKFEFFDRNYEWQVRSFTNSFCRASRLNKKKIE